MGIRMGSAQFMYNYQHALNNSYQNQAKLYEQADGSSIHRPSDNPINYTKLLRHKVNENENEQYRANVNTAASWMNNSDAVMIHMTEIMKTIEERSVNAADEHNSQVDCEAIYKEMFANMQELLSAANTQIGDRYLFAGQKDLTQPFSLSVEDHNRGLPKTLDTAQSNFFKPESAGTNEKLVQFLALENDDGDTFYLDTQTLNIYTKELVDTKYKEIIAAGYEDINEAADAYSSAKAAAESAAAQNADAAAQAAGLDAAKAAAADAGDTDTETAAVEAAEAAQTAALDAGATDEEAQAAYDAAYNSVYQNAYSDVYNEAYDNAYNDAYATALEEEMANNLDPAFLKIWEDGTAKGKLDDSAFKVSDFFDNRGLLLNENNNTITGTTGETFKFTTIIQRIATYNGDENLISMVKLNGSTDPASDTVNSTGQRMFGADIFDDENSGNEYSGCAMLNELLCVCAKTQSGDIKWMSSDGITITDTSHSILLVEETRIGARRQLYESVKTMLEAHADNITEDINNVSGTDISRLATRLMELTTLYNMSLSIGGRILPQSLADYL